MSLHFARPRACKRPFRQLSHQFFTKSRVRKPCIFKGLRTFPKSAFASVFEAVGAGNGGCSVAMLAAAFHVMLQGHRGGCVACRRLGLLDVLGHVVEVSQNGGTEPARRDGFCEIDVLLDPLAHLPRLRIGQRLLAAQDEMPLCAARQIRNDLRNQVDHASAGVCLRPLQEGRIPIRMRDSALNADRPLSEVNVLLLQSQDLFRAQGV